MSTAAGFFFSNYLAQIPIYIVWIIALIIALSRWREQPRVARLTTLALSIFLVRGLLYPIIQYLILRGGMAVVRIGFLNGILGIGSSLIAALAWVLLLIALFSRPRS